MEANPESVDGPALAALRMVVLTSSYSSASVRERERAGILRCVHKPIRQAELHEVLCSALRSAPADTAGALAERAAAPQLAGRVLLAEDNPVNQQVGQAMLQKLGLTVCFADNGREALQLAASEPFDLILMDCHMPVMDGYEASAAIRAQKRTPRVPIVALTANVMEGNRERCLRSGFTSPPRFTASNMLSYAAKPGWGLNYVLREKFSLPNLATHVSEGSSVPKSVAEYFTSMLDQSLDWKRAEAIRKQWDGPFCLKGIVAVEDARRAVDIGASAIMVSNHGGRQRDGSIAPFDALAAIVDAVGDKVEVICDGGITRGTHVLKALSVGAKACSGGRLYLYALAAAGCQRLAVKVSVPEQTVPFGPVAV